MSHSTDSSPAVAGYITVEQAAVQLGVAVATVWRLLRTGALRRHRLLGRTLVEAAEVEQLVKQRGVQVQLHVR